MKWSLMSEVLYLDQTFTDNVTNIKILVCQHARFDCKLWKVSWLSYVLILMPNNPKIIISNYFIGKKTDKAKSGCRRTIGFIKT